MLNYDSSILHVELWLKYITCWTTTQVYYLMNYDLSMLHVELRLKYITCWTTTQVYYMLNYDSSIHVEPLWNISRYHASQSQSFRVRVSYSLILQNHLIRTLYLLDMTFWFFEFWSTRSTKLILESFMNARPDWLKRKN